MASMNKTRAELREMFLAALKEDKIPWRAAWSNGKPQNAVTHRSYRGINNLYLSYVARERGYEDPRWCTFNQAKSQGWSIQKGAKAVYVEYWGLVDPETKRMLPWSEANKIRVEDPERYNTLQLRSKSSAVFHASQVEGIPAWIPGNTSIDSIRGQRDTLLRNMHLGYEEGGGQAFYSPAKDQVTLPPEQSFDSPYGYLCTFLHECGHATGHESRLNRDMSGKFGDESYAREELRAEIASAFTSQTLGLNMPEEAVTKAMERHQAYIQSWIGVLENEPNELFAAIRDAEAISDYLIEKGEFAQGREAQGDAAKPPEYIYKMEANPRSSAGNDAFMLQAYEKEESGKAIPRDVLYIGTPEKCQELLEKLNAGEVTQEQVKGLFEEEKEASGTAVTFQGEGTLQEQDVRARLEGRRETVREIHVEEGITALDKRALWNMPNLQRVVLPHSLEEIGYCAMWNCPALEEIEYKGTISEWDKVFKGYDFLPEQFSVELEAAEQTRLDQPYDRGKNSAEEIKEGVRLVADHGWGQAEEQTTAQTEAQESAAEPPVQPEEPPAQPEPVQAEEYDFEM